MPIATPVPAIAPMQKNALTAFAAADLPVRSFVPFEILDGFCAGIDGVLGEGTCHVLSIRPQGGVEMKVQK